MWQKKMYLYGTSCNRYEFFMSTGYFFLLIYNFVKIVARFIWNGVVEKQLLINFTIDTHSLDFIK